jgi:hypothetical protein
MKTARMGGRPPGGESFTRLGGLASFASLLLIDDCGELRSAPHAVLQGAPAREAMPQKTTARQACGPELVLKTFGIALNSRRKNFWRANAQNRPPRPATAAHSPKFAEKIRKE